MQNKGFVKVFSVLLTLVCLFYLSFSFVTAHYNSKAATYAGGDPEKESAYLDSLSTKKVWPGLSFWPGYSLKECREMEVTLGLDLKGGMNVILELNVADVIRSLSNNNQDENFNKALESAYARQAASQSDFIDLFSEEYKKLDPGARLSAVFSTFELREKITPQSSDAQVISVLKDELKSAIDNSFNVLRTRIDRFGVVSPNIQRLETAGRILVELPGVKEPERVRKLLQGSANLEFWETFDLAEIYQSIVTADNLLATLLSEKTPESVVAEDVTPEESPVEEQETPVETDSSLNEADSLLAQLSPDAAEAQQTQSMEDFAKQHPLLALLSINNYNGQIVPGPVVGYAQASDMEKISELLNTKQVKDLLPRYLTFKWAVKAFSEESQIFELYAIKSNRDGTPALGGDVVTDASSDFAQQQIGGSQGAQEVSMTMNAEGAKAWARLTKDNI
ncbi:MAG: protein translocase subunit SecDF, partial [Tannerellaceae bacterium]|nr:protein translocase subunit SecDF [Tannerellaceae bacterium]